VDPPCSLPNSIGFPGFFHEFLFPKDRRFFMDFFFMRAATFEENILISAIDKISLTQKCIGLSTFGHAHFASIF